MTAKQLRQIIRYCPNKLARKLAFHMLRELIEEDK